MVFYNQKTGFIMGAWVKKIGVLSFICAITLFQNMLRASSAIDAHLAYMAANTTFNQGHGDALFEENLPLLRHEYNDDYRIFQPILHFEWPGFLYYLLPLDCTIYKYMGIRNFFAGFAPKRTLMKRALYNLINDDMDPGENYAWHYCDLAVAKGSFKAEKIRDLYFMHPALMGEYACETNSHFQSNPENFSEMLTILIADEIKCVYNRMKLDFPNDRILTGAAFVKKLVLKNVSTYLPQIPPAGLKKIYEDIMDGF